MRNIVEQLWYNDFSPSDAVPDTDAYIEAKRKHEKRKQTKKNRHKRKRKKQQR